NRARFPRFDAEGETSPASLAYFARRSTSSISLAMVQAAYTTPKPIAFARMGGLSYGLQHCRSPLEFIMAHPLFCRCLLWIWIVVTLAGVRPGNAQAPAGGPPLSVEEVVKLWKTSVPEDLIITMIKK